MMATDAELDAVSRYAEYALFLLKKAFESPSPSDTYLRDILNEASEYAQRSGNDDAMITVGKAWLTQLEHKHSAIKSLLLEATGHPFHGGSTWADNFRRLHTVLGTDALPLIRNKLPECEKRFPHHFLKWADNWSLLGIRYRPDAVRCIKAAELRETTERHCSFPSSFIAFAESWSRVPGKRNDQAIVQWLQKAEQCARLSCTDFLTMHLIECAWGWRNIYRVSHQDKQDALLLDAERAAHKPNDYFLLTEFITHAGEDIAPHRDAVARSLEAAESSAHTKEDWMSCSSIWAHFGESPDDADRCWSYAHD